ncbi:MAG: phosphatidate cytidylyltransferase [Gammaproteobacteria bacterium]|nr:phosphatidate cytidylyltransferase [Gammaproteobacteria bacterium]
MLLPRVITAIILASVLLGFVLFLDFVFVKALFTFILFISSYELLRLVGIKAPVVISALSLAICLVFYLQFDWFTPFMVYQSTTLVSFFWLCIVALLFMYRADTHWLVWHKAFHGVLGIGFLIVCIHSLLFIHQHFSQGGWFMLYLMSIVWVADIGAYFSGKRFGKHKLAPAISPGKSIEGVIGGLLLNVIWAWLVFTQFSHWGMSLPEFMIVSLLAALISVPGDLYESILKRQAGMKDSGTILPGHGGILDRIDSVIAAAPVFVAGLFLVGAV